MTSSSVREPRTEVAKGTIYGFSAYLIWGIVPIYWPKLQPARPLEILSHRILWSLLFLIGVIVVQKKTHRVVAILRNRRQITLLALASVLIAVNWGLFIWCSVNGHLLDSSLGYFITPLVSVGFGVVFFKERLRNIQWVALSIAASAVVYLTIAMAKAPTVAIALAFTFGIYGYVKKLANVDAIESLTVETLLLAPVALGYLAWLASKGENTFFAHGTIHSLWLASAGVVTAIPLLMFGAAAIRVPLSTLGMLQYLGPTLQYFIGLYVFNEIMSPARFHGFVNTWVALIILSIDGWRHRTSVTKDFVPDMD